MNDLATLLMTSLSVSLTFIRQKKKKNNYILIATVNTFLCSLDAHS